MREVEACLGCLLVVLSVLVPAVQPQADGNPHGWDRKRRCDEQDYSPKCGPCEGVGGIPYGSLNDEIDLTSCEILGGPEDFPNPHPIVWGNQWTLPVAYEILIGKKQDPFCFQTFPGNDSVGELCYRKQTGSKIYDMNDAQAIREDLELETPVGNMTSTIIHQGVNFWIVNRLPWYAGGIHQCICTKIRDGFEGNKYYYPVQYNWVDKMVHIGRERIGIEYIDTVQEMDHWAFGPHHLWSNPETGNIIRMWQPFNGLQIYPGGVANGAVDPLMFMDIPPKLCKSGFDGALIKIGCTDEGYPESTAEKKEKAKARARDVIKGKDKARAYEKVPRGHYKGVDFGEMSSVLNGWLNASTSASPCSFWKVEEIQQLQALFYLARESEFDSIYQGTLDNRRLRHDTLKDLQNNWQKLNKLAENHPDKRMQYVRRDGHCHEAVMWYVHHISQDMKEILKGASIPMPMLSPARHGVCTENLDEHGQQICKAYEEQVTCASCHSNELPNTI